MIVREESGVPLAVTGLSVAYRDEPVLWDVSWSVRAGSMTAVVGPNGAGKTTLLSAALGLVPRLAGDVRFWGQPFSAVRDRVAHVPQRESVDWDFPVTARDVVRMGATRGPAWWLPDWLVPSRAGRREAEQRAHPRRGSLLAAACGACLLFVLLSTGALLLLVGPIYLGGAAEGNSTSIVSPYA